MTNPDNNHYGDATADTDAAEEVDDWMEPATRLAWTFALLKFPQGTAWSNLAYFGFGFIHGAALNGRPTAMHQWHAHADAWHRMGFTPVTYELLNATVNTVVPRLVERGGGVEHRLAQFGLTNGAVGYRKGRLDLVQWGHFPRYYGTMLTEDLVEKTIMGESLNPRASRL